MRTLKRSLHQLRISTHRIAQRFGPGQILRHPLAERVQHRLRPPAVNRTIRDHEQRSPHHGGVWQLLFAIGTLAVLGTGRVAAQETMGQELCGTPIADFINRSIPLVVALVIIVGTVFAFLLHVRAGVARDAEQARFYFDWRNRAAYTAVTAPLLAFLLQMLLGFTGTGISDCINLVPFF